MIKEMAEAYTAMKKIKHDNAAKNTRKAENEDMAKAAKKLKVDSQEDLEAETVKILELMQADDHASSSSRASKRPNKQGKSTTKASDATQAKQSTKHEDQHA